MYYAPYQVRQNLYPSHLAYQDNEWMRCDWPALRGQLLTQWRNLSPRELDKAWPDRHAIAVLVQRKYGIAWELVENYLTNLERTLPLAAAS